MNEIAFLKRKIKLKKQGVNLINDEVRDLQIFLVLNKIKKHLESKMNKTFDPGLSKKLDCVNYLLDK